MSNFILFVKAWYKNQKRKIRDLQINAEDSHDNWRPIGQQGRHKWQLIECVSEEVGTVISQPVWVVRPETQESTGLLWRWTPHHDRCRWWHYQRCRVPCPRTSSVQGLAWTGCHCLWPNGHSKEKGASLGSGLGNCTNKTAVPRVSAYLCICVSTHTPSAIYVILCTNGFSV